MAKLNYLELPVADAARAKAFYTAAFGWEFADYGPTYAATATLGLQADPAEQSALPLSVIEVADLDAALAAVEQAGGIVTKAIFGFPGGRRFHFTDRNGHELAAMQPG